MTLSTHPKAGQLVSDRPIRLVRIVRRLCAVLVLQVSIGFAVAQQYATDPQQQQVQKEPRDPLKEEIMASENQTAKQGPESLSDSNEVSCATEFIRRSAIAITYRSDRNKVIPISGRPSFIRFLTEAARKELAA
jgi:hypothetical protein